jgi:transposase
VPTSGHRSSGSSGRAFAVVATRRIWSAADRRRIVGEANEPGVNVSAVARLNGVSLSLLYRWRKDAAAARAAQTAHPGPGTSAASAAPAFVPVALLEAPVSTVALPTASAPPASLIEITLAGPSGGVRTVRVAADVDAGALARIVAALEGKP